MKFTDILELAKKGYTPADIRELMALKTEETQTESVEVSAEVKKEQPEETVAEESAVAGEKPEKEADNESEIIKLKKEIEALQMANTRRERPEPEKTGKSDSEILADMARRFM